MKRKFSVYLLLLKIFISLTVSASEGNDEDSWLDPDAWARDHLSLSSSQSATGDCCKCSEVVMDNESNEKSTLELKRTTEDAASIIYLKKFIVMLFNRKHLKYESNLQIYERSITFTLQPSQVDKLEQLQDPRDLDNILTEIFKNIRIPNMCSDGQRHQINDVSSGFMSSVFQIFWNVLKLTNMSEVRFLLVVTAVILIAFIIKNRFDISLLTFMCCGIFIYGYLHTYLECNREIEVNKMLEILKRSKGEEMNNESGIVKFLKGLFSNNKAPNLEHEQLKNSAKLSLGFCRPDHVLIMYFNDIFLKYLQVMLEQCTATITSLNGTLSFPYNIISGVFLICTICYILKLTFKYILSPSAWMQFVHRKPRGPQEPHLSNTRCTHIEDRVSGENLKLLLNAINVSSNQNTMPPKIAVSGVQEVKEAIESPSENESKEVEETPLEAPHKNNNSRTNLLNYISDVTLEDLPKKS